MKYTKPLITLMDCNPAIAQKLVDAGYNVLSGSFGTPYTAPQNTNIVNAYRNNHLSQNYAESDIVIIDLTDKNPLSEIEEKQIFGANNRSIQVKVYSGIADSRPLIMYNSSYNFNRIFNNGGIFIIFSNPKINTDYYFDGVSLESFSNYAFLSDLESQRFDALPDKGNNINLNDEITFAPLMKKYLEKSSFSAVLDTRGFTKTAILASNKFGQSISEAILPEEENQGVIFLFPHFNDKTGFIHELIESYLPDIKPELFPDHEGKHWIEEDIYQPLHVVELKNEIKQIEEKAKKDVEALSERIDAEKKQKEYLSTLLTGNSNALERAVEQSLRVIGFKDVLNCDEDLKNRGITIRDEDLHIRDGSPLILVEIKGVTGTSTQEDALQVSNYIPSRMKELSRLDVRGLSIINHQRNIPLSKREKNPFTENVLTSAVKREIGLLTTWNLYRLVRSYIELGWTHEVVRDLFYKDGFIDAFPSHYELIGVVEGFMERHSVVGIRIQSSQLCLGDRIAFEFDIHFREQVVESLQHENVAIEKSEIGQRVAVKTTFTKHELKDNMRVFRVNSLTTINSDAS